MTSLAARGRTLMPMRRAPRCQAAACSRSSRCESCCHVASVAHRSRKTKPSSCLPARQSRVWSNRFHLSVKNEARAKERRAQNARRADGIKFRAEEREKRVMKRRKRKEEKVASLLLDCFQSLAHFSDE